MQPTDRKSTVNNPTKEGSPSTKPCAHSEMSGTAVEQLSAKPINNTDDAGTPIHAGPVPLFLVPKTLSAEIQAHGGDISDIAIHRTGYHIYSITLTKTGKSGHKQGQKPGPKQKQKPGSEHSQNPGGADAD